MIVNFSLQITEGDKLLLESYPGAQKLAAMVGYKAMEKGAIILPRCDDRIVKTAILAGAEKNALPHLMTEMVTGENFYADWCTKAAYIRSEDHPRAMDVVSNKIMAEWTKALTLIMG